MRWLRVGTAYGCGLAGTLAESGVAAKKECTVFPDGAAEGGTEIVLAQRGKRGAIEGTAGVHDAVAEEFE